MKIFRVTNDILTNQINKVAGDWDDIISIPDIADSFTDDKYEKYNPLCYDFWKFNIVNNKVFGNFSVDFQTVADSYNKNNLVN